MPNKQKTSKLVFKKNKYTKVYYRIIDRAKDDRSLPIKETHHIIPKSLGGTDEKENLASLTPREHFICHLLLTKMTAGNDRSKMIIALWGMKHRNKMKMNSRLYEKLKLDFYDLNKRSNIEKYGEKRAKEIALKIGIKSKGRYFSPETRKKMSNSRKGRPAWNKGLSKENNKSLQEVSNKLKGKERSLESRKSQSTTMTGKKRKPHSEKSKLKSSISNKNRPYFVCPWCGTEAQKGNFRRWHGDKCKYAK